jgi:hypothetical protein
MSLSVHRHFYGSLSFSGFAKSEKNHVFTFLAESRQTFIKIFLISKSSKHFSNFGGTSAKFEQKLLKMQYFKNWAHKSNFQKKSQNLKKIAKMFKIEILAFF